MSEYKTEISKKFRFEAAHRLPFVPEGHKCARLHGHSFSLKVTVGGEVNKKQGWIIDYAELKSIVKPFVDQLDHNYLNEISGLENPTSENIALWLAQKIAPKLRNAGLVSVKLSETCDSSCTVYLNN